MNRRWRFPGWRPAPLSADTSGQWAAGLTAAAAAAALLPFFIFGQASGHDIDFHLTSWMEVARQWHQGVIFPRWAAGANYGFGEPRFIFYPPISWLLGAALGSVLTWNLAPTAFIFLCLAVAGLAMHRLARTWLTPHAAVAAAVLYAVNPYHLVNIYLRSDFAELLASAAFPLALHFALVDADGRGASALGRQEAWRNAAGLAVVYGAIWLTNAPAAVVASYALGFVLAVRSAHQRSLRPMLFGGIGLVLGLALAGVYIVPARLEQGWVNIAQVISPGLSYGENYLFTATLDPEHNLFNLQVSAVAALLLVLTGVAAILARRRMETGSPWTAMFAVAALSAFLLFPISAPAWRDLPELHFVQFPWRWLFPLAVSMCFFLGSLFENDPRAAASSCQWRAPVACGLLLVIWSGSGVWIASKAFWNSDEVDDDLAMVQGSPDTGQPPPGYDGTDEYCPDGTDNYDLNHAAQLVAVLPGGEAPDDAQSDSDAKHQNTPPAGASMTIERWGPQRKSFTAIAQSPVRAELRLLYYPAWRVLVNGAPVAGEADPATGQLFVPLDSGRSEVEVRFGRTADRTAGGAVSSIAFAILLGFAVKLKLAADRSAGRV